MSISFEARVLFDVPDDISEGELGEISQYIKEAVDKWRYVRQLTVEAVASVGPWKMMNIDVSSLTTGVQVSLSQTVTVVEPPALIAEVLPAKKKIRVVVQKWEESEQGWGVRPDGYSIHPDEQALFRYMEAYRAKLPLAVPYEYERPCGTPYEAEVELDEGEEIGDGKRIYRHHKDYRGYPGDGGKDGWK